MMRQKRKNNNKMARIDGFWTNFLHKKRYAHSSQRSYPEGYKQMHDGFSHCYQDKSMTTIVNKTWSKRIANKGMTLVVASKQTQEQYAQIKNLFLSTEKWGNNSHSDTSIVFFWDFNWQVLVILYCWMKFQKRTNSALLKRFYDPKPKSNNLGYIWYKTITLFKIQVKWFISYY